MDKITELRRLQNSLVAIHSLSEDVLVELFSYFKPIHSAGLITSWRQTLEFLCISHVCWLWRKISCTTSYLWNVIPYQNSKLELTELFLKRSRSCPLSITLAVWVYTGRADIERVVDHFGRVRDLRVIFSGDFSDDERLAAALSRHRFPQLETFCHDGGWPRVDINFLHGPLLRKVSLRQCTLLDGWRFPASIRSINLDGTTLPSAAEVITSFSALPEIQMIRINRIPMLRGLREGLPIAVLQRLTSLTLKEISPQDDLLFFLRHIRCPQLQSLILCTSGYRKTPFLKALFGSEMVAFLLRPPTEEPASTTVLMHKALHEHDDLTGIRVHITTHAGKRTRVLDLASFKTIRETDYVPIVLCEAETLGLRVRNLTVRVGEVLKDAWAPLQKRGWDTLVKITVCNSVSIAHLLASLKRRELAGDTAAAGAGFLPHLLEISVHEVSLTDVIDGVRLDDLIKAALIARAQCGRGLRKVSFWSCSDVSSTYVEELKSEAVIAVEVHD
jgi:hypothetical protein